METKVISFPNQRARSPAKTGDEKLVSDIRRAWRKLARTIRVARAAGLTIETDFYEHKEPQITRRL